MSTVLLVEDSAVVREPLAATLSAAGYTVLATADGSEAMTLFSKTRPDLVLLDINLPGIDGLSILKQIRANQSNKSLPVIMLTAVAEKERVVAAMKLGISSYILKSRFSLSGMLEQVRQHLAAPGDRTEPPLSNQQCHKPEKASPQASAPAPLQAQAPSYDLSQIDPDADPLGVLRSLKPLMPRSELTERVESCSELKGLSPAVSQVLRLTGTDRCSIEQVAKAISQDHAIALKILKLANSAVYTRGEPVDSVQMAVSRIGLGQIRQTVLNLSVIEQFNGQSACAAIHLGQFWEHAIAVGIIAAELAHALEEDPDTAFTMGLLHDVGRMIFAEQFGEVYQHVLDVAAKLQLPAEQVESRMLLYNHADVMDRVLHSWRFPKQLINPIVFHHLSASNIRGAAPRQIVEVAMLALANRLAHALMLGSSGNEVVYATNEICGMLKLDAEVIQDIHAKAREETDKVKLALLATSSTANWPQLRQVHRDAIVAPFRPLFVSQETRFDSYGILCDELTTGEPEAPPNVGVIHLMNARDRVWVTSAFRSAESAAGVGPLPLIVLSPAGKLTLETSLMAGRRVQTLATPFVVSKFTSAINSLLATDAAAA